MARHVESVPPGCSAPPPELPEPRQPFEMVRAGPDHEPAVAHGAAPPPRRHRAVRPGSVVSHPPAGLRACAVRVVPVFQHGYR